MGDDLGNKHAALVSLNFGHYYLKEGTYTLIGAETAQALPTTRSITPSFGAPASNMACRGFGNASIFNRWGYKTYGSSAASARSRTVPPKAPA